MRLAVYTDYTYHRLDGRVYAERAFALFLSRLAGELDRLTIVGRVDPTPGDAPYALPATIEFQALPYYPSMAQPGPALLGMARSLGACWRALSNVDGVWILGPHPLGLAFAVLAMLRGRAVALGVRQDFPRYVRSRNPTRRWMHSVADVLEAAWRGLGHFVPVVAVGPALAAAYPKARTLQIAVSLVENADLAGPEVADARSYDGPELLLLSVGRLEEEKNPLLLADVLARLRQRDKRWRLTVCGEGPLAEPLVRRSEALGVSDHLDLRGYVPYGKGLRDLYRRSHVLLHVSRTEGLPQVLFEAFAARLPVVATAVGGVPAAAAEASLLVEPEDAEAAAAAVERLASDESLRAQLIETGFRRAAAQTLDIEAERVAAFLARRPADGRGLSEARPAGAAPPR